MLWIAQDTEGKPTMGRRLCYIVANIFSRFFSLSPFSYRIRIYAIVYLGTSAAFLYKKRTMKISLYGHIERYLPGENSTIMYRYISTNVSVDRHELYGNACVVVCLGIDLLWIVFFLLLLLLFSFRWCRHCISTEQDGSKWQLCGYKSERERGKKKTEPKRVGYVWIDYTRKIIVMYLNFSQYSDRPSTIRTEDSHKNKVSLLIDRKNKQRSEYRWIKIATAKPSLIRPYFNRKSSQSNIPNTANCVSQNILIFRPIMRYGLTDSKVDSALSPLSITTKTIRLRSIEQKFLEHCLVLLLNLEIWLRNSSQMNAEINGHPAMIDISSPTYLSDIVNMWRQDKNDVQYLS